MLQASLWVLGLRDRDTICGKETFQGDFESWHVVSYKVSRALAG